MNRALTRAHQESRLGDLPSSGSILIPKRWLPCLSFEFGQSKKPNRYPRNESEESRFNQIGWRCSDRSAVAAYWSPSVGWRWTSTSLPCQLSPALVAPPLPHIAPNQTFCHHCNFAIILSLFIVRSWFEVLKYSTTYQVDSHSDMFLPCHTSLPTKHFPNISPEGSKIAIIAFAVQHHSLLSGHYDFHDLRQGGRGWLVFVHRRRIPQSFRRARICKFSRQKRRSFTIA